MKQMIVWLAAIIVAVGVLYALTNGSPQLGFSGNPELKTIEVAESDTNYDIIAKYPQFGVAGFDAAIKSAVDEQIQEIKNAPPPASPSYKNALDVRFAQPYIGADFLSVKLALSHYTGGAHPMTIIAGLNYDRASRKILLLNDVLPLIGLTLPEVSAQATAQLKAKLGEDMFPEGVDTNPENFSSFAVSADKVTFIFQAYQVAAYAAGPQEVSFDRTK